MITASNANPQLEHLHNRTWRLFQLISLIQGSIKLLQLA